MHNVYLEYNVQVKRVLQWRESVCGANKYLEAGVKFVRVGLLIFPWLNNETHIISQNPPPPPTSHTR